MDAIAVLDSARIFAKTSTNRLDAKTTTHGSGFMVIEVCALSQSRSSRKIERYPHRWVFSTSIRPEASLVSGVSVSATAAKHSYPRWSSHLIFHHSCMPCCFVCDTPLNEREPRTSRLGHSSQEVQRKFTDSKSLSPLKSDPCRVATGLLEHLIDGSLSVRALST